jgi:hypothetical protein
MQLSRLPVMGALEKIPHSSIREHGNVGVRFDRPGRDIDWSVSYYRGADLSPSLRARLDGSVLQLDWRSYNIQRIGADFAAPLGQSTVRGEIAYSHTLDRPAPEPTMLPGSKLDYVRAVIGAERQFRTGSNLNLQVVAQHVFGHSPPVPTGLPQAQLLASAQSLVNQQSVKDLVGLAFRAQQRALDDKLTLELSGLAYARGQGTAARARVTYQLNDSASIMLGRNQYFGPSDGILGALKRNNASFVQLRYSF